MIILAISGCSPVAPALHDRAPEGESSRRSDERAAWQRIQSIELRGTARHWEPRQSFVAEGEPRFIGESAFTLRHDLSRGRASLRWKRGVVYPFAREYEYLQVVDTTSGEVRGIDSWYVVDPHAKRPMSSDHFAATWREIQQLSPLSYLRSASDDTAVTLDAATGLPALLRRHDVDMVEGDSTFDVELSEWQSEENVHVPRRVGYRLNGRTIAEFAIDSVALNPTDAPPTAPNQALVPSDAVAGGVPFEWVMRREAMGGYSERDSISQQHLERIGEGLLLVAGRTHNSLIVEMSDHLVVVDAPLDNAYSEWILREMGQRSTKPIRTLVLTHHHDDHSGGARAFVAAGAEVVVGAPNRAHFMRMFAAPHRLDSDALERNPTAARVTEVLDRRVLSDASRSIELVRIRNHHADGMLIAYLSRERLAFVADLWSPGRDALRSPVTFERHQDLVDAVRAEKLDVERVVGGHGGVGNFADLAKAVDAGPSD